MASASCPSRQRPHRRPSELGLRAPVNDGGIGGRDGLRSPAHSRDSVAHGVRQDHCVAHPTRPRRRRGGGSRPRRASGRPRTMAHRRHAPESRRLADGDREASGAGSPPARADARTAPRTAGLRNRNRTTRRGGCVGRGPGRRGRRRSLATGVHSLPPGIAAGRAGRTDAAAVVRSDDRRNGAGVPCAGADHRAADRPGQEDARERQRALRDAAR